MSSTETPCEENTYQQIWTYDTLTPFEQRSFDSTMFLTHPTDDPPLLGDDILELVAIINPVDREIEFLNRIINLNVLSSKYVIPYVMKMW